MAFYHSHLEFSATAATTVELPEQQGILPQSAKIIAEMRWAYADEAG